MAGALPFHVLAGASDAGHGELALALGAEFGALDAAVLDAALAPLVADLAPAARLAPEQALLLAERALGHHLRSVPRDVRERWLGDLLPHVVATRGRGNELAVTLVALEAARRAGLQLGLVASPDGVYLAHPRVEAPILLAPDEGGGWGLLDARELEEPLLAWQCAHEAASLLLALILRRARETGDLSAELRAAELCLALPVDEDEQERLRHQLAGVRARLN